MVKPEFVGSAKSIFSCTDIQITTSGARDRHLGAVIGSMEFRESYVANKVKTWIEEIRVLAEIALTQPHAIYAAFVHVVMSRWSFVSRTIPDIQHLLYTAT